MKRFWEKKGKGEFADLETELRADRPVPSDELTRRVRDEVSSHTPERGAFRLRLGLAGMLSVSAIAVAIALGGVDYPLDAGKGVVNFESAGGKGNSNANPTSNQYGDKVTICHRPPGNPSNGQTLRVSQQGAEAHFRNHPDDSAGPC